MKSPVGQSAYLAATLDIEIASVSGSYGLLELFSCPGFKDEESEEIPLATGSKKEATQPEPLGSAPVGCSCKHRIGVRLLQLNLSTLSERSAHG